MPEFSAWLAGVKERLEKGAPGGKFSGHYGVDGSRIIIAIGPETADMLGQAPTDLALAVRALEAVEKALVDFAARDAEQTYLDDPFIAAQEVDWIRAALHSAFEADKA